MNSNLAYEESWEELIGGEVVAMSPRPAMDHNRVASNIYRLFSSYLKGRRCEAIADGTELYLTEEDRFVPDGMIVCDPEKIKRDGVHGAPDLVVEVLSPSTGRYDRGHKMKVYAACGVREYWLVSPKEKFVEQYLLENGTLAFHEMYTVMPDYLLERMKEEEKAALVTEFKCSLFDDLSIRLEDVFERIE